MPTLTRWFIKSALVYFVLSLAIGVVIATHRIVPFGAAVDALTPVYFHLFMVGWVAQMIFGVAFWMFPRYSRERPRRSERLALVTYLTLNAGLVARAVAEPMLAVRPEGVWAVVLAASALLQWTAALAFAVNTWGRVKER